MIGKVYESLVNVSTEADERGDAGIFYTPRTEIDLMCRLAVVNRGCQARAIPVENQAVIKGFKLDQMMELLLKQRLLSHACDRNCRAGKTPRRGEAVDRPVPS